MRAGNWMSTRSGTPFWPLDPDPTEIHIDDIAHSLAMQCRFNGHSRHFYSVAEHSVYVSMLVPEQFALEGLLHDGAEAYIGDVIRPLKRLKEFDFFREIETRVEEAIAEKFQLAYPWPQSVKIADESMVRSELLHIVNYNEVMDTQLLHDASAPMGIVPRCWTPQEAKDQFLIRYRALSVNRYGDGA